MAIELTTKQRERFWSKSALGGSGCWIWQASKNWRGVGFFSTPGHRNMSAPRVAWTIWNGRQIPEGKHVLHSCDNPSCINPEHLFIGDHAANMRDKSLKGRARRGYEHRPRLLPSEVRLAASLRAEGHTWAWIGRYFDLPYQTIVRRVRKEQNVA